MFETESILREIMADAGRLIHENWNPEDGADCLFGAGGICSAIADFAVELMTMEGFSASVVSSDNHDSVCVRLDSELVFLDIPHGVYERGRGHLWEKKEASIEGEDVALSRCKKGGFSGIY